MFNATENLTIDELEIIAMTLDKLYEDSKKNFGHRADCCEVLDKIQCLNDKIKRMRNELVGMCDKIK